MLARSLYPIDIMHLDLRSDVHEIVLNGEEHF